MKIIKITNLLNNGTADYKGLNLANIQAGSQIYPETENTAYFNYAGELIEHPEISIITQEVYDAARQAVLENMPMSDAERIAQLEADVATANYALMMGGLL